jgi:addiction module RelE/StbE family toxin
MKIRFAKKFEKRMKKLPSKLKGRIVETIEIFAKNPNAKLLRNHALKGGLSGRRAISVTGDVRIIFREYEDYTLVLMLDVGSHNQVY